MSPEKRRYRAVWTYPLSLLSARPPPPPLACVECDRHGGSVQKRLFPKFVTTYDPAARVLQAQLNTASFCGHLGNPIGFDLWPQKRGSHGSDASRLPKRTEYR
ncbi:uncharacterized protein PgNI_00858 [Pyricularia grisea]|uniref:Uncharacterized protein n=1 Tax=Pyricularia grisea TaxID=148305 RepID=A0A6P8BJB3_PYRGI|nr:uncharacterized protein PgNI_00858 [Pyricularia grisea]TLD16667.1 hypothetical protein PgNI_00858 [Pyricularia grisea]